MLTCELKDIASTSVSITVTVIVDERTFNVSLITLLLVFTLDVISRRQGKEISC